MVLPYFLLVLLMSEQRVFFSPLSDSRYQLKSVQVVAFLGLVYASPPGIQVDAQCLVAMTTRTGKLNILEKNKTKYNMKCVLMAKEDKLFSVQLKTSLHLTSKGQETRLA